MRLAPLLIALLLVACGTDKLTGSEERTVGEAQADVIIYGVSGDAQDREAAQDGVHELIALQRRKPGVRVDKRTIEQLMQDVASQVDQTDPDLAGELDRALGP